MSLPPELASTVAEFLRETTLETPGAVVIGTDHVARAGASTTRQIQACVFDTPGKRTDKSSASGQVPGARSVVVYALADVHTATGEGEIVPGELLHWQGSRFEISEATRWASGDTMMGDAENAETFFECRASKVVRP
jgi:hypothetical protein